MSAAGQAIASQVVRIWQGESVEIGVAGTPPACSSTRAKCRDLIPEDALFLGGGVEGKRLEIFGCRVLGLG